MTKAKTNSQRTIQKLTDLGLIDSGVSENYKTRIKELRQLGDEQICRIRWYKENIPNEELKKALE
ncbi:MAG TPA: hypothetical protein DEG69_02075 [Flavobacteriaceae bacterium]|nr:hypothetical protein [Flavobacteriaceae bacterium]|tara:strand:+ start:164 stop:358 length:195 start_codon:yes stop_codon:yes gene_type:complete